MPSTSKEFLLASWGTSGNLNPLLTAARQLRRHGHGVRIIADPGKGHEVEEAGFNFVAWQRAPVGIAADPQDAVDTWDFLRRAVFEPAGAYAADIQDEIDRVPTDALLSIDLLFGAAIGAEAAGIPFALLSPHISIWPLPGVPPLGSGLKPPRTPEQRAEVAAAAVAFASRLDKYLPALNEAQASLGLAPLAHVLDLFSRADRVLMAISRVFDFSADELPGNVRYVGPLLDPPGWTQPWTPPWNARSRRPRALITFSTGPQGQDDLAQRVIDAMGGVEIDAVVTAGPALEIEPLRPTANVKILSSAPHDAVMKEVSLVVTQGGHGTVSRALINGLPLLILPNGRDQNDNGWRVEAKGAGLALPPTASEAEIAATVNRLIHEPHFRDAARRLGEAMIADIGSSALVGEMEAIAAAGGTGRQLRAAS